ncbi:MAG: hypothetical protein R2726_16615 [Acidimicrobiales bacterium]
MGLLQQAGRDLDGDAVVLEGLARPRLQHHVEALVHASAALLPLPTEQLVLDRPVAEPGDDGDAPTRQQVEHGDVLGQADGIVQRQQQGRHVHRDARRPAGDGGPHHQRGGQEPVLGGVVLGQHQQVDRTLIGPLGHVEGRGVEAPRIGGLHARRPHVEADDAHGHDGRSPLSWRPVGADPGNLEHVLVRRAWAVAAFRRGVRFRPAEGRG